MKKIFYFIASAIVALGAVACQNDINENIAPESEGLSFTATIGDLTRVAIVDSNDESKGTKMIEWEGTETLIVMSATGDFSETFEFTNTPENTTTFTCNAEGVEMLKGKFVSVNYNMDTTKVDCSNHEAGSATTIALYGVSTNFGTEKVVMECQVPTLHFNCNETIVLEALSTDDQGWFADWKSTHTFAKGEHYISLLAANVDEDKCTLTAYINDVAVKSTTKAFKGGVIYNLGTIEAPETLENWGIVGAHQGWNTANLDPLYKVANSNTYARYNMTFADGGFKFYGTTTEIVTVEHPAVTTGEEGDWYFQPNSNWKQANARFAIYFYGTSGETWVSMKDDNGDGIYVANNPATGTYENMIFCRMNPATPDNNWDNKWNQTGDLEKPTNGNNCFSVPSGWWDGATTGWSVHTPEIKDAWTEEVEEVTTYWVGKASTDNITNWVTRWSNNGGNDNIVVDTTKTYDVYFSLGEKQDWGFEIYYTVLEHGSPAPELK